MGLVRSKMEKIKSLNIGFRGTVRTVRVFTPIEEVMSSYMVFKRAKVLTVEIKVYIRVYK